MPRVTHVFKTYFPETSGGLEEAVRQCATYAAAQGFTVKVVCVGPADYTVTSAEGICTQFYKKTWDFFSNPFSMSFARGFSDISRHTDLLHFHFPWPTAEMLALVHAQKTPSLVTFHCDIHRLPALKTLYLPFIKRFLKRMDRICVTSRAVYDTTPYLWPFRRKIEEIPLFMNEQRFAGLPSPDVDLVNKIDCMCPFALFVGVLRWYKGLDILLDAARNCPGHVVIVGSGPLYDHLARRIRNESLDHVHLLGFQPDRNLLWLIRQCRMVVLPSVAPAEAFGQILLEGLYFGRPLISTELGTGTSRVNRHGVTGLVIRPGCSQSLVSAMNTLFENPALADQFGRNARHQYTAGYTPRIQGEKYVHIYRALLQS
jgi:O-antigen biosynthesis alpha-1,3-mannosyltransferase